MVRAGGGSAARDCKCTYLPDSYSQYIPLSQYWTDHRCAFSCRASARSPRGRDRTGNSRRSRCRSSTSGTRILAPTDRLACMTIDWSPEFSCALCLSTRNRALAQRPSLWCTCAECLREEDKQWHQGQFTELHSAALATWLT